MYNSVASMDVSKTIAKLLDLARFRNHRLDASDKALVVSVATVLTHENLVNDWLAKNKPGAPTYVFAGVGAARRGSGASSVSSAGSVGSFAGDASTRATGSSLVPAGGRLGSAATVRFPAIMTMGPPPATSPLVPAPPRTPRPVSASSPRTRRDRNRARDRGGNLTTVSANIIDSAKAEYSATGQLLDAAPKAAPATLVFHPTRITDQWAAIELCMHFVRAANSTHACFNAKHATARLALAGLLDPPLPLEELKYPRGRPFLSVQRGVQRFARRHKLWVVGRDNAKMRVVDTALFKYLADLALLLGMPRGSILRLVWYDESYIHQHYHNNRHNWIPKNDAGVVKHQFKGGRYVFIWCVSTWARGRVGTWVTMMGGVTHATHTGGAA